MKYYRNSIEFCFCYNILNLLTQVNGPSHRIIWCSMKIFLWYFLHWYKSLHIHVLGWKMEAFGYRWPLCFYSNLPFKISENGEQLNGNFEHVENLAEDGREMGAIAVDNFVILFTVRTSQNRSDLCYCSMTAFIDINWSPLCCILLWIICSLREIIFTQVLELPGLPVKLKFLHKSGNWMWDNTKIWWK